MNQNFRPENKLQQIEGTLEGLKSLYSIQVSHLERTLELGKDPSEALKMIKECKQDYVKTFKSYLLTFRLYGIENEASPRIIFQDKLTLPNIAVKKSKLQLDYQKGDLN